MGCLVLRFGVDRESDFGDRSFGGFWPILIRVESDERNLDRGQISK